MKVSELLEGIRKPLIGLCILFFLTTLAAYVNDRCGQPYTLIWNADLRHEGNLAVWFQSALFLICGLSFGMIGWAKAGPLRLRKASAWFLRLVALGCVFLSADETLMIHERFARAFQRRFGILAGTAIHGRGYSWPLVYGPVAFIGAAALIVLYVKLISQAPLSEAAGKRPRRNAAVALAIGLLAVPAVLGCEVLEAWLVAGGAEVQKMILPCFEEALELVLLMGLLTCNTIIARLYDV